ncbi:class I SAM-dependent methyltransferase [Candidatus Woesearchaeota archaeon]|nr:class I SAM-dependent methyltransferase [Candidatus Woesearchaeota archaeon]
MTHYYDQRQTSKSNKKKIWIRLKKIEFDLFSASGVFSKSYLDKGTELLLNKMIMKNKWKVLDLGCGYGVVGIAVKKLYPDTKVLMTDVNERAIKLARENIKMHNLENIQARDSYLFKKIKDDDFDTILVNPPQSAGKKLCFKLIEDSYKHLKNNSLLQLVARHNKGGKELKKKIDEVFDNTKIIAKGSGFRIYCGEKINP